MNLKYFKIRKSVMLSWVTSYILILLIPLIINSIIYVKSMGIIEKQVMDSNTSMLNQLQSDLDGHISEIENLSYKINANTKLKSLMDKTSIDEIFGSYTNMNTVLDMNENFNVYTLTDRFISWIYIYFKEGDMVWSDSDIYTKKDFYDKNISNKNIDFKTWEDMMQKKYSNENFEFYVKGSDNAGIKTVAHFQSIPIELSNPKANLVIILDPNKLNAYIKNISKVNNSLVYIIDKDNNVLFNSSNNPQIGNIEKYVDMKGDIGINNAKYQGEQVVVSYISSKTSNWKYVCIIPNSVFKEKVVYIKNLTIACFLFCIIFGGIAITWFAKKNYNPLKELLETFKSKFDNNKNKEYNEFGFIKNSIIDVYNEKERISNKLELQNNSLRLNFISRLLKGRFNNNSPDFQVLESYGINFNSENFIVVVFYIEVSLDLRLEDLEYIEDEYMARLDNMILEEFKGLLGEEYKIYSSKPDEMLTCILNIGEDNSDIWKTNLDLAITKLSDSIKNKTNLAVTVSVSQLTKSIRNIHRAYEESMEAMEYRLFDPSSKIIYYDEIKLRGQKNYDYYYNIEDEQKLINSIKIGDFNRAREMVEAVLHHNFSEKNVSIYSAKLIIIDILSTFIKAINDENILQDSTLNEDKNFIDKVLTRKTIDDMKIELINSLRNLCEYMLKHSQVKNKNKVIEKINLIVEKNYDDENLNVSTLAIEVGMNAKYVSALYKEYSGESIVDLINGVRIKNAKELLKEGLSIAIVSKKVGFNNSNALIRSFKKYVGITPGQFKEL